MKIHIVKTKEISHELKRGYNNYWKHFMTTIPTRRAVIFDGSLRFARGLPGSGSAPKMGVDSCAAGGHMQDRHGARGTRGLLGFWAMNFSVKSLKDKIDVTESKYSYG